MKTRMNLQSVKWFEVILKSENDFVFENIIADTMENACQVADSMFGKGNWQYVVET